jgi:hypothetical protein
MWGCHVLTTRHLSADDDSGVFAVVWHGVGFTVGCVPSCPLLSPLYSSPSLLPSPFLLLWYPRRYIELIIRSVFGVARGDMGVSGVVGGSK